jgi:hypothetical protein
METSWPPPRAGEAALLGRAFLSLRDLDRGLGFAEELQAQGRSGRRRHELARAEALDETHASTTNPESRLFRKSDGREAKLCFMGHVLMENRRGLAVAGHRHDG